MNGQSKWITPLYIACFVVLLSILFLFSLTLFYSRQIPLSVTDWTKSGAIAAWTGLIPASIAAFATAIYAGVFYKLQMELNSFSKNSARDNRLIEISTQWNSFEFVRARNRAFLTIKAYDGESAEMYKQFCHHQRLDEWIEISLIALFIERLSRLLNDRQIDLHKTSAEFCEAVTFWVDFLMPLYEKDETDASLVIAMKNAKAILQHYQSRFP